MITQTDADLSGLRARLREKLEQASDPAVLERMLNHLSRNGGVFNVDQYGEEPAPPQDEIVAVPLGPFANFDEAGAAAVLGSEDAALIAEDSDVMIYGDGGAGKTTLAMDLAFHLGAGRSWLGIPVPRRVNVLVIENEGPRPLFRRKLKRKLEHWPDDDPDGAAWTVRVLHQPWGKFTFASADWREKFAELLRTWHIDVLIAGPLTRIGMNEAGTLQQVRGFTDLVHDVRERYDNKLAVILVHHQNKAGAVSGAWEGAGDTLLHVQAAGNGHTIVHIAKARWDPERHGTTLKLAWAAGEGFELEGERDRLAEIKALFSDGVPRIVKEIAAPVEKGGIGANADDVKEILAGRPDLFESVTGDAAKALGRHPSAIVWKQTRASESAESGWDFQGGEQGSRLRTPALRESEVLSTPVRTDEVRTRESESAQVCCCVDVGAEFADDGRCSRCGGWPS